jgi:hypothetical protein
MSTSISPRLPVLPEALALIAGYRCSEAPPSVVGPSLLTTAGNPPILKPQPQEKDDSLL